MNCVLIGFLIVAGVILFSIEIIAYTTDSLWHEPKSGVCPDCNYMIGTHKYWRGSMYTSWLCFRCDVCNVLAKDQESKSKLDKFKRCELLYKKKLKEFKKIVS